MPSRNALASVRLSQVQKTPGSPYHISIQVWSHSYDHPDPSHRNSLVNGVYLTQLPSSQSYATSNVRITDRYGIDQTLLWMPLIGGTEIGFEGYTELDTVNPCGPGYPRVLWSAFSGVYDERCLADPLCDARRLQTYRPTASPRQLGAFSYLLGPVTFAFDIALTAAPTAVRLRVGHVGGNAGIPSQRSATLPDETFVIQFP